MSSVVPVIDEPRAVIEAPEMLQAPAMLSPAPPPRERPIISLRWIRTNAWGLADQVLISGTNFATGVLTIRALHHDEFGMFSVIYGVLLLCNIFQSTLVTQAHNVLGATRDGDRYKRYTGSAAAGQLGLVGVEALLALPIAIIASLAHWQAAAMLWALIPAIVAWQLQEFVRRVLYTEGRYAAAFWNDVISYGGQTLALALLYAAHAWHGYPFTGAIALYVLAATSALGAILGLWQLRHSLVPAVDRHDLDENWHFGKWLLGGELLGLCSSLLMQVWLVALLLGTMASANLRAVQILFGPTRLIAFFLATVLPIRFARTLHAHGAEALKSQVRHVFLVLAPLVGVYCMLLAVFPQPLLKLVYGKEYAANDAATVLALYSISAFLSYMQMVIAAALTAGRKTRAIFTASRWGCYVALLMSPICIRAFGAPGSIISIIMTTLVGTVLLGIAYHRYSSNLGKEGV